MHTMISIFGIIANIILVLAVLSIIAGLVWVISPLKDKMYFGAAGIYEYYTPLGGRGTGVVILCSGFIGFALGLALDRVHFKLSAKFGSRI